MKASLSRIDFTYDPLKLELLQSANNAFDVGYLGKQRPDLSGIFDTKSTDEVLKEKGFQPLEQPANATGSSLWSSIVNNVIATSSLFYPYRVFALFYLIQYYRFSITIEYVQMFIPRLY